MVNTRDEYIYMAKVCEQTERFDDMLVYMKKVLDFGSKLETEDRNLLSVAYKNSVGTRRTAWRVISSIESKEEAKNSAFLPLLREYKVKIESELDAICKEIIDLLETKLIKAASGDIQMEVFYWKMKGDYHRYIAEYATGDKHKTAADNAFEAYDHASHTSATLDSTDPIRLGLALNFSVFYYEVRNDSKSACILAKQAFDDAIADIEKISEDNYKDSTTIMQLIRDNLTLWSSEVDPDLEGGEDN